MKAAFLTVILLTELGASANIQNREDDPAKALALVQESIRVRGGNNYLNVRSIATRGEYTPFVKGVSGLPQPFVDYVVYPDRERTEFGKGDRRFVQTNVGNTGWIYDAEQKRIRDQNEEQIKRWLQGIRYDLDNLLRRGWREEGAKLVYLGRREAWRNTFSEAIRVDFADGASVTLHFDSRSKLPMMSEFKMIGEEGTTNEQVRYFQWIDFGGIRFPKIQDAYREGIQSARIYYETVDFNMSIEEKLFARPANLKEIK